MGCVSQEMVVNVDGDVVGLPEVELEPGIDGSWLRSELSW